MQFFAPSLNAARNASQNFWAVARLSAVAAATPLRGTAPAGPSDAGPCGWFDSTLDLRGGLEVSEQDCDTLYQLWELASH